jgi:hypothetical protein
VSPDLVSLENDMEVVQSKHRSKSRIAGLLLLYLVSVVSSTIGWNAVLWLSGARQFNTSGLAAWFSVLGSLMSIGIAPLPVAFAWHRCRNLGYGLGEECWRVGLFGIVTGASFMLILSPLYFVLFFFYEFRW